MSLRYLRDPTLPVGLADELESFLHVLIYNGVRFLFHTFNNIAPFMDAYFDGALVEPNGQKSAPYGKDMSMDAGCLKYTFFDFLEFTDRSGHTEHPMNHLLRELFSLFKSRYCILDWEEEEEQEKKRQKREALPSTRPVPPKEDFFDPVDFENGLDDSIVAFIEKAPSDIIVDADPAEGYAMTPQTVKSASVKKRSYPRVDVPTKEDYERAAKLETHDAVIAIFQKHLMNPTKKPEKFWPTDDKLAFDRLYE